MTWAFSGREKKIYLTFDDGPIPELTPWVLDELARHNARATFFCVGDNIRKYPQLFRRVFQEGHAIGNHTYNHLSGWRTPAKQYVENARRCEEVILVQTGGSYAKLFRPPYGQITPWQYRLLAKTHRIIMWDCLTGDFDSRLSPEDCHRSALRAAYSGSIVVYHENLKAAPRLQYSLPLFLKYFSEEGFQFCAID